MLDRDVFVLLLKMFVKIKKENISIKYNRLPKFNTYSVICVLSSYRYVIDKYFRLKLFTAQNIDTFFMSRVNSRTSIYILVYTSCFVNVKS